jgi:hypothetical protein
MEKLDRSATSANGSVVGTWMKLVLSAEEQNILAGWMKSSGSTMVMIVLCLRLLDLTLSL